ncbi:protein kinase domain-containing protein [Streptomyces avicenniae]|uniref:serine/threonine-protein kinase n=1 Tax=Streptomyces avicenniae TaxID=500153 RepID=UPI00069B3619|nr:serine/threonine-protein kinase [Streptomyces avicenniae]
MTNDRGTEPERLGEYVVERRLGSGGMGVVYLARTVGGRALAVKVVRPEYARDPGFRARFRREVAAARRVSGAFTAPVVDADPEGDPPWLATLYVPGGSLTDRVDRDGPLAPGEATRVGAQLAEALRDIHRCGLVHRDLKPGNVLLAEDGVRLIDFGISRALSDSHRLTEDGAVLGSPPFMAPEQLTGGAEVTVAADVFALGAVVAYAVTGRSPFESGGDPLAVAYRVVHEEPDLDDVPDGLRELVTRCLAKDPEQRPDVAELLRMAVEADSRERAGPGGPAYWPEPVREQRSVPLPDTAPGVPARRRRRWTAAGVAAAVLAVAGVGVWLAAPWGDGGGGGQVATGEGDGRAAPFSPWEKDLRDFGVLDAATGGFSCDDAGSGLLCTSGGELSVLLHPDGEERFRHRGPRDAVLGPAGIPGEDGTVYTRSDKGLVALDADGEELWEIDAPELMGTLRTLDDTLVLQNGDSTLRFYRTDDREQAGTWEAPGRYVTATAAHGDRLLVETRDDASGGDPQLMLLDAAARPLWSLPVTPPPEAAGMLDLIGMDGEAAYFQEFDPEVPAITAVLALGLGATGEWTRTELPQPSDPRGVLGDGAVFMSSVGGQVTAVDALEGEVMWDEDTGVRTASAPTVTNGSLYLSDAEGRLYAVSARDGSVTWRGEPHPGSPGLGSDGWAPAPVVTDEGVAYVVTLGNTLYATSIDD